MKTNTIKKIGLAIAFIMIMAIASPAFASAFAAVSGSPTGGVTVKGPDGQEIAVTVTSASVQVLASARENLAQGANQKLVAVIDIIPPVGATGGGTITYPVGKGYKSASIYHFTGTWQLLESNYNATTGIVTATTASFSPFAIVATEDPTATPTVPEINPDEVKVTGADGQVLNVKIT